MPTNFSFRNPLKFYTLFGIFAVAVLLDSGTDLLEELSAGETIDQMFDDILKSA